MKRLIYFFSVVASLGGCRLDKSQDLKAGLPGKYGYYKEQEYTRVWDTLDIKEGMTDQGDLKVIQQSYIQRKRDGKYLPVDSQSRKMTAQINPSTGELYIVQRGKTYLVDRKLKYITDKIDTFYRAGIGR